MNFFEAFPELSAHATPLLAGRKLRLLSLAAIVCDERAFYFELSEPRFWVRSPQGTLSIGVDAAKVRIAEKSAEVGFASPETVRGYLARTWACETALCAAGQLHLLSESREVVSLAADALTTPYFCVLTPPRLGGGDEIPDALVQAAYLMTVRHWRKSAHRKTALLRIERAALGEFLAQPEWDPGVLRRCAWATLQAPAGAPSAGLPAAARLRPVLVLRALSHLWDAGLLSRDLALLTDTQPTGGLTASVAEAA